MTAVEWLHEILATSQLEDMEKNINLWFQQAKEMEKQQQGYSEEEVKDIMAETWIRCVGNDGNDFKELRDKILEQFKKK